MSMETYVVGIVPVTDKKWEEMKLVYDLCLKNNIKLPEEVEEFFGDFSPDESGMVIEIPKTTWDTEEGMCYEVKVEEIPKHVKIIRFYNSW